MTDLGYQDAQVQEVTQNSDGTSTRFLLRRGRRPRRNRTWPPPMRWTRPAGLGYWEADAPAVVVGDLRGVRDELNGVTGPFETVVPAPLVALQAEIDALPDAVETARTPPP